MILLKKSQLAKKLGVSKSYISKLLRQGILKEHNGLVAEDDFENYRNSREQSLRARLQYELIRGERLKARVMKKQAKLFEKRLTFIL